MSISNNNKVDTFNNKFQTHQTSRFINDQRMHQTMSKTFMKQMKSYKKDMSDNKSNFYNNKVFSDNFHFKI